jgi:hypothetical protein
MAAMFLPFLCGETRARERSVCQIAYITRVYFEICIYWNWRASAETLRPGPGPAGNVAQQERARMTVRAAEGNRCHP